MSLICDLLKGCYLWNKPPSYFFWIDFLWHKKKIKIISVIESVLYFVHVRLCWVSRYPDIRVSETCHYLVQFVGSNYLVSITCKYTHSEYTVRNVKTTTALFRANSSLYRDLYMVVPTSLLVIVTYFYPHHAKLQTSLTCKRLANFDWTLKPHKWKSLIFGDATRVGNYYNKSTFIMLLYTFRSTCIYLFKIAKLCMGIQRF